MKSNRPLVIQVCKGRGGWFFRIRGSNGKILCHSEMYTTHAKAVKTANLIHNHMFTAEYEDLG